MKYIKKWIKSPIHIMVSLMLILVLGVGSIAFFTDMESIANIIRIGNMGIETEERLDGLNKENIGVKVSGNTECYVRIRVDVPTVSYKAADGATHQAMIKLRGVDNEITASDWKDYNHAISFTQNGEDFVWEKKTDGFWYLNKTLSSNETVTFIESISYDGLFTVDEDGTKSLPGNITLDMLSIPITSEAVQAENIPVGGAIGTEAAYAAFQYVAQASADSEG